MQSIALFVDSDGALALCRCTHSRNLQSLITRDIGDMPGRHQKRGPPVIRSLFGPVVSDELCFDSSEVPGNDVSMQAHNSAFAARSAQVNRQDVLRRRLQ